MNNRGFALIITLVVTALMVAAATEMIHQIYVDTALSRGFRDGQQASLLAESGVTGGVKLLQQWVDAQKWTSLSDRWAVPFKVDDASGSLELLVTEESARLNLNDLVTSKGEYQDVAFGALKRLGRNLTLTDDLWPSLADWIDSDDLTRSGGAETAYYKGLNPPYSARNAPLSTVAELSLVKGFTPEIVSRLQPFVTVYAWQQAAPFSRVNINTAAKEVLMALDERIDSRMADRIMEVRRLKPFKDVGELSNISGLESIASILGANATVKGTVFRITAVGRSRDAARTVEAVVRLVDGGSPEFLFWQEY